MSDEADRFALRAWTACGTIGGGLVGLVLAPRVQWSMRRVGVDPLALGPGLVFVVLAAISGGFLTWRAMRPHR